MAGQAWKGFGLAAQNKESGSKMILLLSVIAVQMATKTAASKSDAFIRYLHISFTNNDGTEPIAVVRTLGSKRGQMLRGYTIRQWVSAWKSLLVTRGTKVYRWDPQFSQPEFMIDVKDIFRTKVNEDRDYPICSVDPDGHKLAVIADYGLTVIDLRSTKVAFTMSEIEIGWKLRKHPQDVPNEFGIAWSPNGNAVALDLPTKASLNSSDGTGPTQCIVVYLDRRVRRLGLGAPVAWLADDLVLCAVTVSDSDQLEPRILAINGAAPTACHRIGTMVGWDGTHILLSHPGSVEIFDRKRLTRLALVPVPEFEKITWYPTTPLVAWADGK